MKKFLFGSSGFSAAALTLLLASGTAQAAEDPHRGGTLRLTAQASGGTLDPQISYLLLNYMMEAVVYDGLTTFVKAPGSLSRQAVPDLADSLPVPEDDGLTYRFHLRPGIHFSNGKLLTVDDVAASMRRIFKAGSPTAGPYFGNIVGAAECLHDPDHCTLKGGVEVDPATNTVTFHLVQPDSEFLDRLAFQHASVLPADTPTHDTGNVAPPGTGPYQIVSYDPNVAMRLERNPYFHEWDKQAQPDGHADHIYYAYGLDPEAEVTAVENGQFDWMADPVPMDRLAEIGSRYISQIHLVDSLNLWYAALNVNIPPFNDLRVRQALNYAVNHRAMVIHNGGSALAYSGCQILPEGAPGYEPSCDYTKGADPAHPAVKWTAPDLDLARKLVHESGTEGQSVAIITSRGGGMTDELRSTLASLGYRASVRVITQAVQFPYIQNSDNNVQIAVTGWNADYPAASSFIQTLFSCETFHPHSDNSPNISGFCSHDIDAIMQHAASVSVKDVAAGNAIWAQADRALMAQAPLVPLMQRRTPMLVSARVKGDIEAPIYDIVLSNFIIQ